MTTALSTHWTTGQSALEDANLTAVLGWIAPPPGLTGPEAAARAEDPVTCPPAGPATDPGFDNIVLAALITAHDTARDDVSKARAAQRLEQSLRTQLAPTWALMWQGLDLLRTLPEAAHVPRRWSDDVTAFSYFVESIPDGIPQARRDSAVSAVRRLLNRERALETLQSEQAYDDPYVMLEYRLIGNAFHGIVIDADPTRTTNPNGRRVLRPLLRVSTTDPFTPTVGDELTSIANPAQKATVIDLEAEVMVLELSGGMGRSSTAPAPGSVPGPGDNVGFARFGPTSSSRPAQLPAPEDTPWTHGGPPPEWTPPADDIEER
jgi:hypothetical protein